MKYTESDTRELKRELTDVVKEVIISFLNTKGGIIYVGVNDDGTLNSVFLKSNRDDIDLKLGNWIQDTIYPVPFKCVDYSFNADGVLVIKVKEGSK